jgi:hypothetical protein
VTTDTKTIADLRAALFDALQGVKAGTLDLDKARAINEIGKTLVDTAKVEVDYLRVTNGDKAPFIDGSPEAQPQPGTPALPPGITAITQHRLGR